MNQTVLRRKELGRFFYAFVILCIVCHVFLLVAGVQKHFVNADEIGHLPAGVSHWKFRRFELYKVNPPLVRAVTALPAWLRGTGYDWSYLSTSLPSRPEFEIGFRRLKNSHLRIH